jgi:acetoin utilization deacetylase AcuC-like enzyme
MSLVVIGSARFAEHQTPRGHPECPERADVMHAVACEWARRGGAVVAPYDVTHEQLVRVHDEPYVLRMENLAGVSTALDADTCTSPETIAIARLAAGAAIDAVERVMSGTARRALALVRPPGHHAERDLAMGFCFYNNIAVAAAHARTRGARRVAIVDYDVHHGNGTQQIFEADPQVLYVSAHQFPYYPGTGAAQEIGVGAAVGATVNIPLEIGATDEDYRVAFTEVVTPVVRAFGPDVLLVSAGFDAHERDPLGGMRLTTGAFEAMTQELCALADECCEGRLVAVTEGGYDLRALEESLLVVMETLGRETAGPPRWPVSSIRSSRGANGVAATKRALAGFWNLTG